MNEADYNRFLSHHSRALEELLINLNYFIEDVEQLNVFSVTHRLKSYKSAFTKSTNLNIPIKELQDLAGIRIVVATKNEIDVVSRFFTRQEYSKDITIESDRYISKKNGYRARHIIFEYKGSYNRSMYPAKIEAQLQTIFEHAFNFISRAWIYKSSKSFSENWEEGFYELSKNLALINSQANELHTEVIRSSIQIDSEEPLSPYSYKLIVKQIFDINIAISDAVDACRYFVDIGYTTNKLMKRFYEDENIMKLYNSFKELYELTKDKFCESIINTSLYQFYDIFGVRYTASLDTLEKLQTIYSSQLK